MTLTVFGLDTTKRKIELSSTFMLGKDNKKLSPVELQDKARSVALSLESNNYNGYFLDTKKMKTYLFILAILTTILKGCVSDNDYAQKGIYPITSRVCDSSWTTSKLVTHYERSNDGAVGGGLLGATGGWMLIGGPIGVIGGAIVGASIGSNPKAQSWTETVNELHTRYIYMCGNNYKFYSQNFYPIGTKYDTISGYAYQNY